MELNKTLEISGSLYTLLNQSNGTVILDLDIFYQDKRPFITVRNDQAYMIVITRTHEGHYDSTVRKISKEEFKRITDEEVPIPTLPKSETPFSDTAKEKFAQEKRNRRKDSTYSESDSSSSSASN